MKRKVVTMLCLIAVCTLSACGDDTSIVIPQPEKISNSSEEVSKPVSETIAVTETMEHATDAEAEKATKTGENTSIGEEPVEEESEEVSSVVNITISAAGDVTLGNYVGQGYEWSFAQMWKEVEDENYFLENVKDIFEKDSMTLVNLEGPLTDSPGHRENQTYCISGSPDYVSVLTAGSVEAVGMANNHRRDYLEQGTTDTVAALEGAGIVYAYDTNVGIYETQGIRIGYVSVSMIEQTSADDYMVKGIAALQEENVDLIIASCHWGIEREFYPTKVQEDFGKRCIDLGADLVIGHHPHVIQGIEEYQGKYIVYSLGNFCFGANRNPADKDCIIFQQTFTFDEGAKSYGEARIIPCSISSVKNRNDYKPTPATGEEKARIMTRMSQYSSGFGVTFDEDGRILGKELH